VGLKEDLLDAVVSATADSNPQADSSTIDVSNGSYNERYAHYQTEAIVKFLENCEFRITQLNAPMVLETFKIPEQPVDVLVETLLGEYQPVLKTLKKIGEPLGLSSAIDSLEGEIKKVISTVAPAGAVAKQLDVAKDGGGLESTGYVFIGDPPDSQSDFNVEDEDGQKTFTTVKFFRDDNESLI
tara:strand:+ start:120 stop:671 length:552 start_codon:yes stop_codon:yes gene_type:complete